MREGIGAVAPAPSVRVRQAERPATTYAARAVALLRARAPHALLLALVTGVLDFLRALPLLSATTVPVALLLVQIVSLAAVQSVSIVAGVTLAQAAPLRGWRRPGSMLAGAWSGVALGLTASAWISVHTGWNAAVTERVVASLASHLMYIGWEYAAIGTAVALFYAAREREVALTRSAQEAELARVEVARSMMESRLAILRARVEPEFLFGALDEVRALYTRDRAAAEAMIDALIAYLRAALPQMRGGGTTVGREVDLALAYVAVLQVPRGDLLAVEADVAEDVEDAALPPMVLLPLAQAALASADIAARRRFAITAAEVAGRIAIDIEVDGGVRPPGWRDGGPDAVHRTLQAYFGDEAQIEFATEGIRHRASLRLPAAAIASPRRPDGDDLSLSPQAGRGLG